MPLDRAGLSLGNSLGLVMNNGPTGVGVAHMRAVKILQELNLSLSNDRVNEGWRGRLLPNKLQLAHFFMTLFQSIRWPAASNSRASADFQPPLSSIDSQTTPAKSLGISTWPRIRAQTFSRPRWAMK